MSYSVSTVTGKTKVKVVLLGNQAVGKSSLIEKYIHDKFDENSNVFLLIYSANSWDRLPGKKCDIWK